MKDWTGVNFVQDFKCNWFKVHKGQSPKPILPKMDLDQGCRFFELRTETGFEKNESPVDDFIYK